MPMQSLVQEFILFIKHEKTMVACAAHHRVADRRMAAVLRKLIADGAVSVPPLLIRALPHQSPR